MGASCRARVLHGGEFLLQFAHFGQQGECGAGFGF